MNDAKNLYPVRKTSQIFLHDSDFNDCDGMSVYGSCERCGCNLYEDDADYYCDQCDWWIENVTPEER